MLAMVRSLAAMPIMTGTIGVCFMMDMSLASV